MTFKTTYRVFLYIPGTHRWIREAESKDLRMVVNRFSSEDAASRAALDSLPPGTEFLILKAYEPTRVNQTDKD